jgi:hypothetical protein
MTANQGVTYVTKINLASAEIPGSIRRRSAADAPLRTTDTLPTQQPTANSYHNATQHLTCSARQTMAIDFAINNEKRLVNSRYGGRISAEHFLESYTGLYASLPMNTCYNEIIFLLDDAMLDLDVDAMLSVCWMGAKHQSKGSKRLVAFVAKTLHQVQMTNLYRQLAALTNSAHEEIRIFDTLDRACKWLNISEADLI